MMNKAMIIWTCILLLLSSMVWAGVDFTLLSDEPTDYILYDNADSSTFSWDVFTTPCFNYSSDVKYDGTKSIKVIRCTSGGPMSYVFTPSSNITLFFRAYVPSSATRNGYIRFYNQSDVEPKSHYRSVGQGGSAGDINNWVGFNNFFVDVGTDSWHNYTIFWDGDLFHYKIDGGNTASGTYNSGTNKDIDQVYLTIEGTADNGLIWYLDDMRIWEGNESDYPIINSTLPPITNSSWVVSGSGLVEGENVSTWDAGGIVNLTTADFSFTVNTNTRTNMSCRVGTEGNYSEILDYNSSFKSSTSEATSHSFTVTENVSIGSHCLYCSFIDGQSNMSSGGVSHSGCLSFELLNVSLPSFTNVVVSDESPAPLDVVNFSATISSGNDVATYTFQYYNLSQGVWVNHSFVDNADSSSVNVDVQYSMPGDASFFAYRWLANSSIGFRNRSLYRTLYLNHSVSEGFDIDSFNDSQKRKVSFYNGSSSTLFWVEINRNQRVDYAKLMIGGGTPNSDKTVSFLTNVNFSIGDDELFSQSTQLDNFTDILNYSSYLNDILSEGCDCNECNIVGDLCSIPFNFTAQGTGGLVLHNLGINASAGFVDCGVDNASLVIKGFEEVTRTSLVQDVDVTLVPNAAQGINYSAHFNGSTEYPVCVYPNWANISTDIKLTHNATSYATRNFFSPDFVVSNTTTNLSLYLLPSDDASTVLINVRDQNGDDVEGAVVKILRFYPEIGTSLLIQSLQTDFNGNTIAKLELFDVQYKIIVEVGGEVVFTSNERLITGTILNINVNTKEFFSTVFENINDAETSLTYDNTTQTFTFFFNGDVGKVQGGCLEVNRFTPRGEIEVCNTCSESNSASLFCVVNTSKRGDSVAFGRVDFVGGSFHLTDLDTVKSDFGFKVFGLNGVFAGALLVLALGLVGVFSPTIAIGLTLVGFVLVNVAGLYSLGWSSVMAVIVVGIILLFQMRE